MRTRTLIGGGVVALVLALVAWLVLKPEVPPEPPEPAPTPSAPARADVVAKKRALRAETPDPDPLRLTGTVRNDGGTGISGALVLLTPKSFEQGIGGDGERAQRCSSVRTRAVGLRSRTSHRAATRSPPLPRATSAAR